AVANAAAKRRFTLITIGQRPLARTAGREPREATYRGSPVLLDPREVAIETPLCIGATVELPRDRVLGVRSAQDVARVVLCLVLRPVAEELDACIAVLVARVVGDAIDDDEMIV